jgi:Tol biopolymer transport system component
MFVRNFRHTRALLCTATIALAACGESPAAPTVGGLRATVSASGPDLDPDGYTLTVDGAVPVTVGPTGSATFTNLSPGAHSVAIGGLAVNCTAAAVPPVNVAAGATANVTVSVTCVALVGALRVVAPTTGVDLDVAYLLYIGDDPPRLLLANDSLDFPTLRPGSYSVRIAGAAPNCTVAGPSTLTGAVAFGALDVERFDIACTTRDSRLLFSSTRGDMVDPFHRNNDLYTMSPSGTDVVRLTVGAGALHATWSPDGRKIAYHAVAADGRFDIHVMNADGSNDVRITTDPLDDVYPQWSPDGTQIAFERGQMTPTSRNVWVMNADGSGQRALTASSAGHPSWSPDGTRIAFEQITSSGAPQIFTMRRDGTNIVELTFGTAAMYSGFPRWSPDGRRVLFLSPRDGASSDIFSMAADGSDLVNLTRSQGADGTLNEDHSWSPDGQWIAFRSNRNGGNPEIYVMKADGTAVTNISHDIWDDSGSDWHP